MGTVTTFDRRWPALSEPDICGKLIALMAGRYPPAPTAAASSTAQRKNPKTVLVIVPATVT
jgi:hypothetical protein